MNTNDSTTLAAFLLNEFRTDDDPWHELATGALTPQQVRTMRRNLEPDAQIEHKLALFGPPSAETKQQRLDDLLARFFDEEGGAAEPGEPRGAGPKVVSLADAAQRRKRTWSTGSIASIVALAAAVLLVWVLRPAPSTPSGEPLMGFELELEDGWRDMRGTAPVDTGRCQQRYHRDGEVSIHLRPAESVSEAMSVALLAQPEGGEARWVSSQRLSPTQAHSGVIDIQQSAAELGLTPGQWTLTFFVTRKGQQQRLAALRALEPGVHGGVTVTRASVCIVE